MPNTKIPTVKVFEVLIPDNAGKGDPELLYSEIHRDVDEHAKYTLNREDVFWEAEQDSIEEEAKARQLANENLLRTAAKLAIVEPGERRSLWADRFTQASIELFGGPEPDEARQLIAQQYSWLESLKSNENVSAEQRDLLMRVYEPLRGDAQLAVRAEAAQDHEKQIIGEVGEILHDRFQPLIDMVEQNDKQEYTSAELRDVFNSAIAWLTKHDDPGWKDWKAVDGKGTNMLVGSIAKTVKIPDGRAPSPKEAVTPLLFHELIVHGRRSVMGAKTGDKRLARGLPGHITSEEGLAKIVQFAAGDAGPDKAPANYINIALATGCIDGKQLSRHELFKVVHARDVVKAQADGSYSPSEIDEMRQKAWKRVDRIYRGGPAAPQDERQAVFTNDISYHVGKKMMLDFIVAEKQAGKAMGEIFDYLMQAKFDPTDPKHVKRVSNPQPEA